MSILNQLQRNFKKTQTPGFLKPTLLISFLSTFLMSLIVLVSYFRLQPEVPLFYSLARPELHLAAKEWLFILPFISLVISLVHSTIIRLSFNNDLVLLKLFAWSTVGLQLILALSLLRIVLIIS